LRTWTAIKAWLTFAKLRELFHAKLSKACSRGIFPNRMARKVAEKHMHMLMTSSMARGKLNKFPPVSPIVFSLQNSILSIKFLSIKFSSIIAVLVVTPQAACDNPGSWRILAQKYTRSE
jgi:hypothetical protein